MLASPINVAINFKIMITLLSHGKMKLLFEIIIVQDIMYARYPASRIYLNSAHTKFVNKKNILLTC